MPNEKGIAWGITAVAVVVRLYLSSIFYLNPDECIHVNAGSGGQWVVHHHPPLALWWIWLATLVSDQEWWLRLLPTLSGALTPLALGLWLRRFLTPTTAWGVAAFVALSPNLALLSIQIRGYPMAILASIVALYLLDRAMAERSRTLLFWHFAALQAAILSEYCTVWVVLAAGLYGLALLARRPEMRPVLWPWVAGQCVTAVHLGLHQIFLLRVVSAQFPSSDLFRGYLHAGFPLPGQNWAVFLALGTLRQFAYLASSWEAGGVAALLAAAGLVAWYRKGDERLVLVSGVYLAAFGALAMIHPFARSRHTALIGMVTLAAVGAGIDLLGRWKWLAAMAAAMALFLPAMDSHNIPNIRWDKGRWDRAMGQLDQALPEGAVLLADRESQHMLMSRLVPREQRRMSIRQVGDIHYKGNTVRGARTFDWEYMPSTEILAMAPAGHVWIVDMGFNSDSVKLRATELGVTTVVDEPGVLYLGRLR